ncbi:MAG: fibronectin type III domain-containing protein [Rhodococcus sp.]|nr:fibronectin type III domain-containing protein [Rhodococcus sp. (in: high G+C Gram-positive bacteria)]
MRTGAIFARGSCRALKWMALVGVVFALGAVEAAAQATLSNGVLTVAVENPDEGDAERITVTLAADVVVGTATATTITVTVTAAPNPGGDATPADDDDWTITDDTSNTNPRQGLVVLEFPADDTDDAGSERYTRHGWVELQARNQDRDAEDEDLTVTADPEDGVVTDSAGVELADETRDITILDDENQNYVLKKTSPATAMEGDEITVTLEAMPKHVQGAQALTLRLDQEDYLGYEIETIDGGVGTVSGNTVTIGADVAGDGSVTAVATDATNMAEITLTTTVDNDRNRIEDMVTVSAFKGAGEPAERGDPDVLNDGPLVITLTDKNELPEITATLVLLDDDAMPVADGEVDVDNGLVTEGKNYQLTLTVVDKDGDAMGAPENLTIVLDDSDSTASPRNDYSLGRKSIRIAKDDMTSGPIRLEIDDDSDIDAGEKVEVTGEVSGDPMYGMEFSVEEFLSLTIVDETQTNVWVADGAVAAIEAAMTSAQRGDEELNVGDHISIEKSLLFETADSYDVAISGASTNHAVAGAWDTEQFRSASNIQIDIVGVGEATVTITGAAVGGPSGVVMPVPQTQVDVAQITVDVMVKLAKPPMPTGLEADAGDGQVTLRWVGLDSRYSVTRYEYDVDASDDWTSTGMSTSVTVTGLTNGTRYVFRVRAVNDTGEGAATAGVGATPKLSGDAVTVKSVSTGASVAESGGLTVTVTVKVPKGTKGSDGKVANLPSRGYAVHWSLEDITDNEAAEFGSTGDIRVLTSPQLTGEIPRAEEDTDWKFTFRLAIGQDLDAEDEKFRVGVSIDGDPQYSDVVTIDDAEEQKYTLSLPAAAKGAIGEGKSGNLTLKADPAKTFDIPVTLALEPNDPSRYTLSETRGMFGPTSFETELSTKADSDRADDTVTVTAYTDRDGEFASLDITVTDANALPAVKATLVDDDGDALDPQPESVMEGETVKVMLTAIDKDGKNMKAAEKLTITLMPTGTADAQDYRLSSQSFEIAKDKESSAAVELMVTEDQDIGEETLMFDAAVAGESKNGTEKRSVAGVLSLMITDGTQKLVWANSQEDVQATIYAARDAGAGDDMTFTAGEMIEVMGALLFSSAEGVTLSYTAESSMSDVASVSVSGGTVMVTAAAKGMADITITAHASMSSGVTINDQTDPGMASIMFSVEVGLEALSIMLSGPEDMNLAEGMSAMVTATANRAVTADTMVLLMRDRAMSTASDDDYMAEAITISADETTGSTTVMAVEDNMAEDMEELVLYGMTEGMAGEVTGEVKFYLWDAAVPALPVIAQLLLAALLGRGGYRRYLRRR